MATPSSRLHLAAAVEAVTLTTLLACLLWRHLGAGPDLSDTLGPLHGTAFVAYVVVAVHTADHHDLPGLATAGLVLAALLPFGGLLLARRLLP